MAVYLVAHDAGCKFARQFAGGHSDMAKRVSDTYNMHIAAGAPAGSVIAVALADGHTDGVAYGSRAAAVTHQHHNEHWFAYIRLAAPRMTVCEAESFMRLQRQASRLRLADRDDRRGGLEVIPRLDLPGLRSQAAALSGSARLPIALGYSKELDL